MAPAAEQWAFIIELLEAAPDRDSVLASIAAGPLEGLLEGSSDGPLVP